MVRKMINFTNPTTQLALDLQIHHVIKGVLIIGNRLGSAQR
jgi:hypothetical protein